MVLNVLRISETITLKTKYLEGNGFHWKAICNGKCSVIFCVIRVPRKGGAIAVSALSCICYFQKELETSLEQISRQLSPTAGCATASSTAWNHTFNNGKINVRLKLHNSVGDQLQNCLS